MTSQMRLSSCTHRDHLQLAGWVTMRFHSAAFALSALVGAGVLPSQTVPSWSVAPQPVFSAGLGGTMQDELLRVQGATMLPSGGVAVVNGKPLEIRVFGSDGRFRRTISRSGNGPGELSGGAEIVGMPGDSIMVFGVGDRRWMIFSPDGKLAREFPARDRRPGMALVRERTVIWTDSDGNVGCAPTVLSRLPKLPDGAHIREMVYDGDRHYWVRMAGAAEWTVYDAGARAVGRITLPEGLVVYRIHGQQVLGKRFDPDGLEEVVILRVAVPQLSGPACANSSFPTGSATPPSDAVRARQGEIRGAMRNVMVAGEVYYATNARYPSSTNELRGMELPSGVEVSIPYAGPVGWSVMAVDRRSGFFCLTAIGTGGLPGLQDGVLYCGT